MKTIFSITYQVCGEEIKSLGLFNSINKVKDAIALHELGGSFDVDVYSAVDLEKLNSNINYQLATYYNDAERLFYSERDVEYHVHEWQFDEGFSIESDMLEVIHLEALDCDEIHESIGITQNRSYCSDIILGCEVSRRENNGEDLSDEDKLNLVSEIDLVIAENDKILFEEGDVCYCIVTHEFKNDK